jgi:hypothetical protein
MSISQRVTQMKLADFGPYSEHLRLKRRFGSLFQDFAWLLPLTLLVTMGIQSHAQVYTTGEPVVGDPTNGLASSPLLIDSTQFSGDFCEQITNAINSNGTIGNQVVIDARAAYGAQYCTAAHATQMTPLSTTFHGKILFGVTTITVDGPPTGTASYLDANGSGIGTPAFLISPQSIGYVGFAAQKGTIFNWCTGAGIPNPSCQYPAPIRQFTINAVSCSGLNCTYTLNGTVVAGCAGCKSFGAGAVAGQNIWPTEWGIISGSTAGATTPGDNGNFQIHNVVSNVGLNTGTITVTNSNGVTCSGSCGTLTLFTPVIGFATGGGHPYTPAGANSDNKFGAGISDTEIDCQGYPGCVGLQNVFQEELSFMHHINFQNVGLGGCYDSHSVTSQNSGPIHDIWCNGGVYSAGTASFTSSSTSVTGVSTGWASWMNGALITCTSCSGNPLPSATISTVNSATSITLTAIWSPGSQANATYTISTMNYGSFGVIVADTNPRGLADFTIDFHNYTPVEPPWCAVYLDGSKTISIQDGHAENFSNTICIGQNAQQNGVFVFDIVGPPNTASGGGINGAVVFISNNFPNSACPACTSDIDLFGIRAQIDSTTTGCTSPFGSGPCATIIDNVNGNNLQDSVVGMYVWDNPSPSYKLNLLSTNDVLNQLNSVGLQASELISVGAGSASTPGVLVTGVPYTSGVGSTNLPQVYINNGATGPTTFSANGTEFGANAPSAFTGNFADFHLNGSTSVFNVNYQGTLTLGAAGGLLNLGTTSAGCTSPGTGGYLCLLDGIAPTAPNGWSYLGVSATSTEFLGATNGGSAGLMVRARPGAIQNPVQTGAVTTATLCSNSAGACDKAGQYHIHFNAAQTVACATNSTGGISPTITWTDGFGTLHSAQPLPMITNVSATALSSKMVWNNSTLGAWASGDLTIDTNGTIIQYAITFAQCATGSATYESNLSVTRLQ